MEWQLLDIQPRELKFIFELKKQSTCTIRLVNRSRQYVAFKVKTTSPKKYCVQPNAGVIAPESSCNFNVKMQAQRTAPTDMICKDKFLVQGTVVPPGTTDEDITSAMFAKDEGRYVEENKLRVSLISPPHSPDLSPINGTFTLGLNEASVKKEQELSGVDFIKILNNGDLHVEKDVKSEEKGNLAELIAMKAAKDVKSEEKNNLEEEIVVKTAKDVKLEEEKNLPEETVMKAAREVKSEERESLAEEIIVVEKAKDVASQPFVTTNMEEVSLSRDVVELKSKQNEFESRLSEVEATIAKLMEDRRSNTQDIAFLREKLATLDSKIKQAGFPLLFVVMVAMISATLGYLLHS
ncbi:hypothetical protein EUGRSUZ_H04422 [Eucalyptus grandis]|uniref:Uncharacterized protein n=2 Tax=Eucalyptus grandis TaxID=71139 RepID=A0ACC3JX03_EUCGR|nr:hypothetical protein EUGRSUZ_H04422 [Eucalyptus grandis]